MNAKPSHGGALGEPVSRGGLRRQVTARLLTAVFLGRFGSGQRLVVQHLAETLAVSPTPVRESLVELAAMGIVDLLPNRGAIVLPFGPAQVREISQVRRVLEVEATRCATGRVDPVALDALRVGLDRVAAMPSGEGRDRDARALDDRLHALTAESCGSARLTAEVGRYLALFRTLRDVCHLRDAATNYSRSDDVPEHAEIVLLLQAGDAEGAARAMDVHIRSATTSLVEVLFSDRGKPAARKRSAGGAAATKARAKR